MAFVEVKRLRRRYYAGFVLGELSFELARGEILTLMGPSGSGKTSLLRNIAGLDIPESGSISVDGKDMTRLPTTKRNVGMIFQDLAIFPHMKVYDNIAYGLRSRKYGEKEVEERVTELATMLRIRDLLDRYPGQISGGQRQRVALARSAGPEPSILLLDEPMSSLDMQLRSEVRSEFKSFARKAELTMIYVTHDHSEGLYMADTTGIMYDGSLERLAPPQEVFTHPGDERTARFFGYNTVSVGGRRLAFYPSDYVLDETHPDIPGKVVSVGFEGERDRIHMITGSGEKIELISPPGSASTGLKPGSSIGIRITRSETI